MRDFPFGNGPTNAVRAGPAAPAPTAESIMADLRRLAGMMPTAPDAPPFGIPRCPIMPAGMAGVCIIEDPNLVDLVEDWSDVRSQSRAARRRRQGHAQRIRYHTAPRAAVYAIGDALVMHPETARLLRERVRTR